MNPLRKFPLRQVAASTLAQHLPEFDATASDDLALSLVRQWLTNDGHAGVVTPTRQFWFRVVPNRDAIEVGTGPAEGRWGRALGEWGVAAEEVPGLLHRLNLPQAAVCRTGDGRTIRLRVEPKTRTVRCEECGGEEGECP
jgi:hypothetical protein